jgi:hypothetical protein
MYKLGVKYFNPINVYTDLIHPEILFIQTASSVIILDVNLQGVPVLLQVITSDATRKPDTIFKMGINPNFLIIANSPSMIE